MALRSLLSYFSEPGPSRVPPRTAPGPPHPTRDNGLVRTEVLKHRVAALAHPSQGGFIVLENASGVDFEFLGLDPLTPPDRRLFDQDQEDAFAHRLLLLGGKWWSSYDRFLLFKSTYPNWGWGSEYPRTTADDGVKPLTERERRVTFVGWPSSGGFWVSEFEVDREIADETWDVDMGGPAPNLPEDMAVLNLARTMDEKCKILKERFDAKFYGDLNDYKGMALQNSYIEQPEAARAETPISGKRDTPRLVALSIHPRYSTFEVGK